MLTGAIRCNHTAIRMTSLENAFITQAGKSEWYTYYNNLDNSRNYEVLGALGLLAAAASDSFKQDSKPIYWGQVPSLQTHPINSTVEHITVPCLKVNSWSRDSVATANTTLKRPVPVLMASISKWRIWTWLEINALITVSGIFLAVLQRGSQAETVRNTVISALLLDSSRVIQHDRRGLCNAVDMGKTDGQLRLRLVVPGRTGSSYRHAYLDVENSQYDQVDREDGLELLNLMGYGN
jgi:hypothetical protein